MLPVICKTGRPFSPIEQHFILCDKETDYFFFFYDGDLSILLPVFHFYSFLPPTIH